MQSESGPAYLEICQDILAFTGGSDAAVVTIPMHNRIVAVRPGHFHAASAGNLYLFRFVDCVIAVRVALGCNGSVAVWITKVEIKVACASNVLKIDFISLLMTVLIAGMSLPAQLHCWCPSQVLERSA
ncbi:MAG: hypothetical protein AAGK03_13005 [Pseudomonadota bacterium]